MVWVHGGGNAFGAGSRPSYDGSNLTKNDVIVVTLNYRLGVLGQLASDEIMKENPDFPSTGGMNYLQDQMQAFRFVKQHIAAFGGNPHDVTIFGESAGGISVCNHIASPLSKGLYDKAIIESGPCTGPWGPNSLEVGLNKSSACIESVGCGEPNPEFASSLECMRAIPWAKFVDNRECLAVYISVDGVILKQEPSRYYSQHKISLPESAPLIAGFNTGDSLMAPPFWLAGESVIQEMTADSYTRIIKKYFPDTHEKVLRWYPVLKEYAEEDGQETLSPGIQFLRINADICVKCPVQNMVRKVSQTGRKVTF